MIPTDLHRSGSSPHSAGRRQGDVDERYSAAVDRDGIGLGRIGDGDFKFDFGNKINCVFCSSICFGVTRLSAEAFNFAHHHAADTDLGDRFAHVFELEGFDRCNNQFHSSSFRSTGYNSGSTFKLLQSGVNFEPW